MIGKVKTGDGVLPCAWHRKRQVFWTAVAVAAVALTGVSAGLVASYGPAPPLTALTRTGVESGAANRGDVIESALLEEPAQADDAIGSDADEVRWFDGRPIRPVRRLRMTVTAYSPDERSCGRFADGKTASGYSVWTNGMNLVAADTRLLPFGSLVSIPGYDDGSVVPVLDRGGRIKGRRLDVLYPTHEIAMQWGVQELDVIVWEYADGRPDDFEVQR